MKIFKVKVAPKFDKKLKVSLIGFQPKLEYRRVNPLSAAWLAIDQVGKMVGIIFYMLWLLISGTVSVRELAGPVGIAQFTGIAAQSGIYSLQDYYAP